VSYSALAEAVKAQCEILEDDPPETVVEKIGSAVEELFGSDEVVPQVRALVGATAEDEAFTREELFDAWRRFLERMAARLPLVLVLEDIHWADSGLLDFVDHLADWAQGPILVLTLARPELLDLRPGWGGGKRNYSAIYLDPLTPEENAAMLEDLLGGALPDELRALVTERSEGNPLFTEEIVRMFIDRGVIRATQAQQWEVAGEVAAVDVPRSIQALIATRLDGLPEDEKGLLQDAAVIGRAFWAGAAARLSPAEPDAVRAILGRLRVKELITPREPPVFSGELEFAFRHVLIRDVAYESLPKALRSAKHVEVARWAEARAGERAEELAEVMAAHYIQAIAYREELDELPEHELDAAASQWAATAGERAMRLWQPKEAYRWYGEAVRLGERGGLHGAELARLIEGAVDASTGSASFAETRELAIRALGLFEVTGDPRGMSRMEHRVAAAAFELGENDEVPEWAERAIARLEPMGESHELAAVLEFYGNFLRRQGRTVDGRPLLERALGIATSLGQPALAGQAALSLGIVLIHLGDIRAGMEMTERGFAAAEEAGELHLLLRAHNNLVSTMMDYAPNYPRGWDLIWRGIELSQRSGRRDYEGWLWQNAGNYAFDQGKLDVLERTVAMTREIGDSLSYHHIRQSADYYEGLLHFLRGDLNWADAALARSFAADPELQALPYLHVLEGDIAGERGDRDAATSAYRDAVERVQGEHMLGMVDEAMTRLIRELVVARRGNEAAQYLEDLRPICRDRPGATAGLAWAEAMLARDPPVRMQQLRAAVEEFEQVGRTVDEARARLDLADALDAAGLDGALERERAHEMLQERMIRAFRRDYSSTVPG
jgi:tetratricopeptide (TPR) repeat protein